MIKNTSCSLNFRTHQVIIHVQDHYIHACKLTGQQCEMELFELTEEEDLAEWAITPMAAIKYQVEFPGESAE